MTNTIPTSIVVRGDCVATFKKLLIDIGLEGLSREMIVDEELRFLL